MGNAKQRPYDMSGMIALHQAYRRFCASPDGEKIMDDLEARCFAGTSTLGVDGNNTVDPLRMAFNEGRRSILLHIRQMSSEKRISSHINAIEEKE